MDKIREDLARYAKSSGTILGLLAQFMHPWFKVRTHLRKQQPKFQSMLYFKHTCGHEFGAHVNLHAADIHAPPKLGSVRKEKGRDGDRRVAQ